MKAFYPLVAAILLSACGVETATSAATAAAAKKQELDQAKQTMDQFQAKLDQAHERMAERTAEAEKQQ